MKGAQDGYPAAHAGLKEEVHILLLCNPQKLRAVLCHQGLVGSGHALSRLKGALYKGIGRLNAAHDLHHDPHFFVIHDILKVVGDKLLHRVIREIPQIQHIFDAELLAQPLIDDFLIGPEHFHYAGSHCSITKYCYLYHNSSLLLLCL